MFSVHLTRFGALMLVVLGGVMWPAEVPAEGRAGSSARRLIQQGAFARALENLSAEGTAGDDQGRLFQRAYCLQQLEKWDQAAGIYLRLLSPGASPGEEDAGPAEEYVLNDYVRLFAATCLLRGEDYAAAETQLDVLLGSSESLLDASARELLGQLYLCQEQRHRAIPVYRRLLAEATNRAEQVRFSYALAEIYQRTEERSEAAALLKDIITNDPSSGSALSALSDYRSLHRGELSGEMYYRAGWVYFHHGRYQEAADAWDDFLDAHPRHELAAEALQLSARACFRGHRYHDSRERCRRLLTVYPRSDEVTAAHYLLARCDEGENHTVAAVERYRQFVRAYPWSQLADDALWRLAGIYERDGDAAGAEREYWELSRQYASRPVANLALWRAGLYAYYRGDAVTAISRLNLFLSHQADGSQAQAAIYWIARAHQASGDLQQAAREMERVIQWADEGYYADRARSWLEITSQPAMLRRESFTAVMADLETASPDGPDDHLQLRLRKGRELIRLGLLSQARRELSAVHQAAHAHPSMTAALIQLYEHHELYGDALRLAVSLQSHWTESRLRQALQPYLYPMGYQGLVESEAQNHRLDPFLILALMRTESLFDPLAESPAGARGLMQIMPATGREIFRQLGAPDESMNSFFEPEWSIRMGAYYLGQQVQAYHGQVQFALAAYNAGPGHASRWLKRWDGIDPDLFVELIDFQETRRFIKKVLATQAHYQRVWGDDG